MKHSVKLSLATLSTVLFLSLSANAHDPAAFDRMMEAEPAAATVSACEEMERQQAKGVAPADINALKTRCDAEKTSEDAADVSSASAARK